MGMLVLAGLLTHISPGFAASVVRMLVQVAEHAAWLTTNCSNQLDYYSSYLKQHRLPGSSNSSKQQQQQQATSSSSSSNGSSPPVTAGSGSSALASMDVAAAVSAASSSRSLAAVADFKPDAARMLLEEELREAFLGTAGSAAGEQTYLTVYPGCWMLVLWVHAACSRALVVLGVAACDIHDMGQVRSGAAPMLRAWCLRKSCGKRSWAQRDQQQVSRCSYAIFQECWVLLVHAAYCGGRQSLCGAAAGMGRGGVLG
jgi:hypothetical protein